MRVSLQLIPEQPAEELLQAAQVADELGYYACYSADEIYHKDAWLLLVAAAGRSERIRLGPCVSPIYLRDPTYVAQLAATLDELSGGRAEVVLGIGNLAMLEQYGIEWHGTRPIARLREAHRVIRTLLDDGSIDFRGDFFQYAGVVTAATPLQSHDARAGSWPPSMYPRCRQPCSNGTALLPRTWRRSTRRSPRARSSGRST
jgi:5,10-methylenetetrahydromethanopterin reductase